jgi:hypothetical protein
MKWIWHAWHMISVYKILVQEHDRKKPFEMHRLRKGDDIKMDLIRTECEDVD